jgi:hypothetical protein
LLYPVALFKVLRQLIDRGIRSNQVLLFLAGQVSHGAFKWRDVQNRRCVLHNYITGERPLTGRNWVHFRQRL